MNILYRVDRYGGIFQHIFDDINPDVLVRYFNRDYNHKDGVKLLLASCTLSCKSNYSLIQGVLEDIGVTGVNIRTMDDLNNKILNNYDCFWEAVQAEKECSLIYCRSILASYPKLMSAKYGIPVALMSQNDEIVGLKNVGDNRKVSGSFYAWFSDGLTEDKRLHRKVIKRCEDDAEIFRQMSSSNVAPG